MSFSVMLSLACLNSIMSGLVYLSIIAYFSGTQFGTFFPFLIFVPTFLYPSQQGSSDCLALDFGILFFFVAIIIFLFFIISNCCCINYKTITGFFVHHFFPCFIYFFGFNDLYLRIDFIFCTIINYLLGFGNATN